MLYCTERWFLSVDHDCARFITSSAGLASVCARWVGYTNILLRFIRGLRLSATLPHLVFLLFCLIPATFLFSMLSFRFILLPVCSRCSLFVFHLFTGDCVSYGNDRVSSGGDSIAWRVSYNSDNGSSGGDCCCYFGGDSVSYDGDSISRGSDNISLCVGLPPPQPPGISILQRVNNYLGDYLASDQFYKKK